MFKEFLRILQFYTRNYFKIDDGFMNLNGIFRWDICGFYEIYWKWISLDQTLSHSFKLQLHDRLCVITSKSQNYLPIHEKRIEKIYQNGPKKEWSCEVKKN